jgi:hypothetical protein
MGLSQNQTVGLIIIILVIVAAAYYMNEPFETVSSVVSSAPVPPNVPGRVSSIVTGNELVPNTVLDNSPTLSETDKMLIRRMTSKNSNTNPDYKKVSFADGVRNGPIDALDAYFNATEPLNPNENAGFSISDNQSAVLAPYTPGKVVDVDKFDADELLPKESNDWFEDVTPTKIKNRHLINIYRPIGVNTVMSSLKNGTLDLRGDEVNPKTFVSPFLNSSYEPDHNIKGLCTSSM